MKRALSLAISLLVFFTTFPPHASASGSTCASIKARSIDLQHLSTQEAFAAFKLQNVLMNQKIEQFYSSKQISSDEYRSFTAYVFASKKPVVSSVPVLVTLMNRLVSKKLIPNRYFPTVIALGEKSSSDSMRSNQLVLNNQKCFSDSDVMIAKTVPNLSSFWKQIPKLFNLISSD